MQYVIRLDMLRRKISHSKEGGATVRVGLFFRLVSLLRGHLSRDWKEVKEWTTGTKALEIGVLVACSRNSKEANVTGAR